MLQLGGAQMSGSTEVSAALAPWRGVVWTSVHRMLTADTELRFENYR